MILLQAECKRGSRIQRKGVNDAVHLTVQDIFQRLLLLGGIIIRERENEAVAMLFRRFGQGVCDASLHPVVKRAEKQSDRAGFSRPERPRGVAWAVAETLRGVADASAHFRADMMNVLPAQHPGDGDETASRRLRHFPDCDSFFHIVFSWMNSCYGKRFP